MSKNLGRILSKEFFFLLPISGLFSKMELSSFLGPQALLWPK